MSFLNPVNEPVLRFSSTDASAPQINYNARVAGDVKTVLKACLVTGYGAKASAGWSIVNEIDHVAEFVSPSVAMSDYRLKIADDSSSNTVWSYLYQGVDSSVSNGSVDKQFSFMNKTSAENGWQLLVTPRGLLFVEITVNPYNNERMARVTNWGAIKSALASAVGANMSFWQAGVAATLFTNEFYKVSSQTYYNVSGIKLTNFSSANIIGLTNLNDSYNLVNIDLVSELYIYSNSVLVGQQPGLLVKTVAQEADLYGVYDGLVNGRPVLFVCIGRNEARAEYLKQYCSVMCLYLDYWEY